MKIHVPATTEDGYKVTATLYNVPFWRWLITLGGRLFVRRSIRKEVSRINRSEYATWCVYVNKRPRTTLATAAVVLIYEADAFGDSITNTGERARKLRQAIDYLTSEAEWLERLSVERNKK